MGILLKFKTFKKGIPALLLFPTWTPSTLPVPGCRDCVVPGGGLVSGWGWWESITNTISLGKPRPSSLKLVTKKISDQFQDLAMDHSMVLFIFVTSRTSTSTSMYRIASKWNFGNLNEYVKYILNQKIIWLHVYGGQNGQPTCGGEISAISKRGIYRVFF